jgi:16S rRNA (uracil1498-N3)-methyltransferase
MSLPRFFLPGTGDMREGARVGLDLTQARHAEVLRLKPGDAVEVVLPGGAWKGDLAELGKGRGQIRLVAPLAEQREAPVPIQAWVPVTAQLSLVDEMLPPLVELGATLIQPVVYARSEFHAGKVHAKFDRWQRIVLAACEQSHRTRIPELRAPVTFEALLRVDTPQKWVAYELQTGQKNPGLVTGAIAITSGPEGGITESEFEALRSSGWQPVSLGMAILRAVTAPSALLGAVQHQLGAR